MKKYETLLKTNTPWVKNQDLNGLIFKTVIKGHKKQDGIQIILKIKNNKKEEVLIPNIPDSNTLIKIITPSMEELIVPVVELSPSIHPSLNDHLINLPIAGLALDFSYRNTDKGLTKDPRIAYPPEINTFTDRGTYTVSLIIKYDENKFYESETHNVALK